MKKNLMTATAALFFSASAVADKAIELLPFEGENDLYVDQVHNITGKCGDAIVRAIAVNLNADGVFKIDDDSSNVIIRNNDKTLQLKSELSDHNKLHCVNAPIGYRIILSKNCSGSVCGDAFKYAVVDPYKLTLITPKGGIDLSALQNILGTKGENKIDH